MSIFVFTQTTKSTNYLKYTIVPICLISYFNHELLKMYIIYRTVYNSTWQINQCEISPVVLGTLKNSKKIDDEKPKVPMNVNDFIQFLVLKITLFILICQFFLSID